MANRLLKRRSGLINKPIEAPISFGDESKRVNLRREDFGRRRKDLRGSSAQGAVGDGPKHAMEFGRHFDGLYEHAGAGVEVVVAVGEPVRRGLVRKNCSA